MAKAGRKKKVWLDDFKEQQEALLAKHARQECLTHEEITYLVAKDGSRPSCREQMMSKMSICKTEAKAMKKLRAAFKAKYPKLTLAEIKSMLLCMLSSTSAYRSFAREWSKTEKLDYTYAT